MKCSKCRSEAVEGLKMCQSCREKTAERGKKYRDKNKDKINAARKEKYKLNREKILAQQADYYKRNRERKIACVSKYYAENKEKVLAYHVIHYARNHDKILESVRQYGQLNREIICEKGRAYYAKRKDSLDLKEYRTNHYIQNRDRYYSYSRNRKARLRGAFVEHVDRTAIFERDNWTCQLCGVPVDRNVDCTNPSYPSIDHIIPIAKGGTHEPANVWCAHLSCNISKGIKIQTGAFQ